MVLSSSRLVSPWVLVRASAQRSKNRVTSDHVGEVGSRARDINFPISEMEGVFRLVVSLASSNFSWPQIVVARATVPTSWGVVRDVPLLSCPLIRVIYSDVIIASYPQTTPS